MGESPTRPIYHDSCVPKCLLSFRSYKIFTTFWICFFFNFLFISFFYSAVLQKAFNSFDSQKTGSIPTEMVSDILRLMGQPFDKKILEELIEEVDEDSKLILIWTLYSWARTLYFLIFRLNFSRIRPFGIRWIRSTRC